LSEKPGFQTFTENRQLSSTERDRRRLLNVVPEIQKCDASKVLRDPSSDRVRLDAQDKNDCRLRIKGQPTVPGLAIKWPLNRCVDMCVDVSEQCWSHV